ncbi:hypothetical protein KL86DES1_21020 [uncultured Desulfovibrio sp.]|uniref:Uncharacterized protein n=1 Tax=uncultured Desulfovibrio sp. TaxID=167968 RepID=A0A212L677_9BACT|nr:hypothetical protein KL86DES1_21020 [uncultured Desulfovibrio sp.]VZH33920.1 conserved protein of unknown function [Desulfovibrio sp. 86]
MREQTPGRRGVSAVYLRCDAPMMEPCAVRAYFCGVDARRRDQGDASARRGSGVGRWGGGTSEKEEPVYWLLFNFLAERKGLEPSASGVTGRRYNRLNYRSGFCGGQYRT